MARRIVIEEKGGLFHVGQHAGRTLEGALARAVPGAPTDWIFKTAQVIEGLFEGYPTEQIHEGQESA